MHSQNKTCMLKGAFVNRTSLVYSQLKIAACYSLCILGSNVLSRSWNLLLVRFRTKGNEHCNLSDKCFHHQLPAYYFEAIFLFSLRVHSRPGGSVGIATELQAGRSGIESQ